MLSCPRAYPPKSTGVHLAYTAGYKSGFWGIHSPTHLHLILGSHLTLQTSIASAYLLVSLPLWRSSSVLSEQVTERNTLNTVPDPQYLLSKSQLFKSSPSPDEETEAQRGMELVQGHKAGKWLSPFPLCPGPSTYPHPCICPLLPFHCETSIG